MEGKYILVTLSLTIAFPSLHLRVDLYTFVMTHMKDHCNDQIDLYMISEKKPPQSQITFNKDSIHQFTILVNFGKIAEAMYIFLKSYLSRGDASSYLVKVTCESQEDETGIPLENVV